MVESVYCAVRTGSLNKAVCASSLIKIDLKEIQPGEVDWYESGLGSLAALQNTEIYV